MERARTSLTLKWSEQEPAGSCSVRNYSFGPRRYIGKTKTLSSSRRFLKKEADAETGKYPCVQTMEEDVYKADEQSQKHM